jgi:hypothetical protein
MHFCRLASLPVIASILPENGVLHSELFYNVLRAAGPPTESITGTCR